MKSPHATNGLNIVIKDLLEKDVIEVKNISDGQHTFGELYAKISELEKANKNEKVEAKNLIDNIANRCKEAIGRNSGLIAGQELGVIQAKAFSWLQKWGYIKPEKEKEVEEEKCDCLGCQIRKEIEKNSGASEKKSFADILKERFESRFGKGKVIVVDRDQEIPAEVKEILDMFKKTKNN
jgi:hypothetical protein